MIESWKSQRLVRQSATGIGAGVALVVSFSSLAGCAPPDEPSEDAPVAIDEGASTSPRSSCTTCYVATNGSDSNLGTQSAPFRHLRYALGKLDAGDTLYVRGGTYVEDVTGASLATGTSGAPVRVVAYPGERPVLEGLLWLESPDDWTFDGLNVTWNTANHDTTKHMVKITDGRHWAFTNAEVWGAHSFAAILVASRTAGEPSNWAIRGNCIHDTYASNDTNQDHLIYANAGPTGVGGVIERNLMFNATNGEGVKIGGPSSSTPGPANLTVRDNTIYNTAQSVLISWKAQHNTITGNLLDKVGGNYGNVRGYALTGTGNVATDNLGFGASDLLKNDPGGVGIKDGGGNVFPRDPHFDSTSSCQGFHPSDAVAKGFGRYAP